MSLNDRRFAIFHKQGSELDGLSVAAWRDEVILGNWRFEHNRVIWSEPGVHFEFIYPYDSKEHAVNKCYYKRFEFRDDSIRRTASLEEANFVSLEMQYREFRPDVTFNWPDDRYRVERVERLLQLAYDRGYAAAKADIRKALGV